MAKNTSIQWTDHTLNFWWGYTKVSPACRHCYAEEIGRRFGKMHFGAPVLWGDSQQCQHRLEAAHAEAIALDKQAAKKGVRYRVFVNSMSDWLDDKVPLFWLAILLETIRLCPNLDFQLLTKRPENWSERLSAAMVYCDKDIPVAKNVEEALENPAKFARTLLSLWIAGWLEGIAPHRGMVQIPPNVWIGTTVENQECADKRIPALLDIPAKVRFLSCEPLLGPVDIRKIDSVMKKFNSSPYGWHNWLRQRLHWVITGGESGTKAAPSHPDWFRSLRDQCAAAQIPFFFKQWGEWKPVADTAPSGVAGFYKTQAVGDLAHGAVNLLDGAPHRAFPAAV